MDFIETLMNPAIMIGLEAFLAFKGIDFDINMIDFKIAKFIVRFMRLVSQNYLEKFDEVQNRSIESNKGKASSDYGLMHNLLLAHPSIDTTVENAAEIDALYLTKRRVTYLVGDDDGINEMARTHVRVCNIDALHTSKKYIKRAIYGVFSTLAVGSATYGIIRWMMN